MVFLLGVSDGAVFVFLMSSYVPKEYSLGLSKCNYFLFHRYFEVVIKHEIRIVYKYDMNLRCYWIL